MRIEFSTIEPIFISKVELSNFQNNRNPFVRYILEEIVRHKSSFKVEGDKEERKNFLRLLVDRMSLLLYTPPFAPPPT